MRASAGTATGTAPTKKGIEDPGEISKNILETPKSLGKIPLAAHALHACKTELIIGGFFLIVRKDLIGFGSLFELFFRFLVPGVFVRVVLDGEFPIGLLYIVLGCVLLYAENFIIIAFCQFF